METDDVQALYGGDYAAGYNDIWQHSDTWSAEASFHVDSIRELLGPTTRWLDAGCGTGWNLSHFQGTARAGLDLSPDMLAQAVAANPDALEFRQGDLRDDVPEWHDAWDLVTCTGQPYSYVDRLDDIATIFDNLAGWTGPDGTCFVPMGDLTDVAGVPMDIRRPEEEYPYDTPMVDAVVWSLWEHDRYHRQMIWPSVSWCVKAFAQHFGRIEIHRWPHVPPWIPVARRILVASDKRAEGDDRPVVLIEHPVPPVPAELAERFGIGVPADAPAAAPDPEPEPEPEPEPARGPGPASEPVGGAEPADAADDSKWRSMRRRASKRIRG
ncbi:MAG: class I SAM-dependent methyltransferase [Actinobacteria bacterium]|nr:class I SAM-dependent methyltransferase [Actinomycetota bacterium]